MGALWCTDLRETVRVLRASNRVYEGPKKLEQFYCESLNCLLILELGEFNTDDLEGELKCLLFAECGQSELDSLWMSKRWASLWGSILLSERFGKLKLHSDRNVFCANFFPNSLASNTAIELIEHRKTCFYWDIPATIMVSPWGGQSDWKRANSDHSWVNNHSKIETEFHFRQIVHSSEAF